MTLFRQRLNRRYLISSLLLAAAGTLLILVAGPRLVEAQSGDLKLEARLIWGTNDPQSPDPTHRKLDTALSQKLGKVFQWRNYFEVNRQSAVIPLNAVRRLQMSKESMVEIRNRGGSRVEVKFFGNGKLVNRIEDTLKKGDHCLTIGGNVSNNTGWFVVLSPAD